MFLRLMTLAMVTLTQMCIYGADALARDYTYTKIEVAPRNNSYPIALNNKGMVLGAYGGGYNRPEGAFIWQAGQVTKHKFPGSTAMLPAKLNDNGDFVGSYYDQAGKMHGFVYSQSKFTTVDYPGAVSTYLNGINNAGVIIGGYLPNDQAFEPFSGFVYANGVFNAQALIADYYNLLPYAINQRGDIAANYVYRGLNNINVAYLLKADGKQILIDPNNEAEVNDLNDSDELIGFYQAFTFKRGKVTWIPYPGCNQVNLSAINDAGDVAGECEDSNNPDDTGFIYHKGKFDTLKKHGDYFPHPSALNNAGQFLDGRLLATPK